MHTEIPDTFDQLRTIADLTRAPEDAARGRELLVRFLDTYAGNTAEQPIVDALCMRFGLLPYVSSTASGVGAWEAFALELHTPPELAEDGFTFHTEQQRVYQRLMDGENVILSAPTSFGKSVVIDALLASERWSNFVLIVPTIALIDETRRRISRFRNSYNIVTHPSEPFAERNIVVMTQERFLEIEQLPDVDFFMIDEFYKLGSGRKQDSRRTLLNLAWTKLKATGAQYYLIGPNIDALDERLPEEFRGSLMRSTFKPVAVDVIDRSAVQNPRQDLVQTVRELDGSTLVFTGSPENAEALAVALGMAQGEVAGGMAAEVADWIAANYDESWDVVAALRAGVAVHTGPLPRGLQRIMVRLFNEGMVGLMVCTSTLIEGVNTSARNVVIFEKKIDGQLIDFFTFSNIRGRAGRMFRHFVGRVVTYMDPPDDSTTIVDIPIETQSDLATDADLIQLPNSALDEHAMDRVAELFEQEVLSINTLRQNRGLDPSLQLAAARELRSRSQSTRETLTWQGRPTPEQARATLEFAFHNLLESHQRRGINFNMMWGKLQNARHNAGDLAAQVDQAMPYARQGQERSNVVTDVLRFQRNWMGHTIPAMLRALQNIQAEVVSHGPRPNYQYLLREIESLYLPNSVAELEEYGLPAPLAIRLFELGLRHGEIHEVVQDLERVASDPAVTSRLSQVELWILRDVVSGISGN